MVQIQQNQYCSGSLGYKTIQLLRNFLITIVDRHTFSMKYVSLENVDRAANDNGRFPGSKTAFSITSTDHSKSNINRQLLLHTYS